MTIVGSKEPGEKVLYDNKLEPAFSQLRRRRRIRVLLSVTTALVALVIVNLLTAAPALTSNNLPVLAVWMVGNAAFGIPLVWGLIIEASSPLDIRVSDRGVKAPGFRWVPAELLRGAELAESGRFILVRRTGSESRRPVIAVWRQELANTDRFKDALRSLLNP